MSVLVVDDDPFTRRLMGRTLGRLGCKVTTAENGEMAIDLILGVKGFAGVRRGTPGQDGVGAGEVELGPVPQEVRFAVVFLDNQMPVMSGVKAVERLRRLGRKDYVVGVTGNALPSGTFMHSLSFFAVAEN